MITKHADIRIKERYLDNNNKNIRSDFRIAKQKGNYFVRQDRDHKDRVHVLFSVNKSFLWKVVMSKIDGAIVTVLPVTSFDLRLAREKGVISDSERRHNVY